MDPLSKNSLSKNLPVNQGNKPTQPHPTEHPNTQPLSPSFSQAPAQTDQPQATYRDILLGNYGGNFDLEPQQPTTVNSNQRTRAEATQENGNGLARRILFSREELEPHYQKWKTAIIVKPLGPALSPDFLSAKLKTIWRKVPFFDTFSLGSGFLLVRFQNGNDFLHILDNGPWFVNGTFLTMRRWEPMFNPITAPVGAAMIWARLPCLPAEFFGISSLQKISQAIGGLIKVDHRTKTETALNFARICVSVDLDKPLEKFVRL